MSVISNYIFIGINELEKVKKLPSQLFNWLSLKAKPRVFIRLNYHRKLSVVTKQADVLPQDLDTSQRQCTRTTVCSNNTLPRKPDVQRQWGNTTSLVWILVSKLWMIIKLNVSHILPCSLDPLMSHILIYGSWNIPESTLIAWIQ